MTQTAGTAHGGGNDWTTPRAFGGGQIRTEWARDSAILPDRRLHQWMPGFRLVIPAELDSGRPDWTRGVDREVRPAAPPGQGEGPRRCHRGP